MSTVSIVINTLNRRDLLEKTLISLSHLRYDRFEVIVVVGPCVDGTSEMLANWCGRIKTLNCAVANLSASRNIGIAGASGDIVAFTDDDAIPEPEWLSQMVTGFDSPFIGAVGGKVYDHTGHKFQFQFANADRLGNGIW
jgi:glycogen(starch) synthase